MMKKILGKLLGAVGVRANEAASDPAVQMVDLSTILFSMSTISNDLPPLEPMSSPGPDDTAINEDDWRQIEFFAESRRAEIQALLAELARFEQANRQGIGFRNVYVRRLDEGSVLSGDTAVLDLASELEATESPAPFVYSGASTIIGRVESGFTLRLAGEVRLYGHVGGAGIMVLGAIVGDGGNHEVLTHAFARLNHRHGLVAVDWRSHMLLVGVSDSGSIEVWRPD